MMIGIGIPNSHNKIGIAYLQNLCVILFRLPGTRNQAPLIPGAVAQLSAFDGSQARRECAEQQRGRHPEGELGRAAPRLIGCGLGLRDNIIDALLRIGLAQSCPGCNELRDVRPVSGREATTLQSARRPKAQYLGALASAIRWAGGAAAAKHRRLYLSVEPLPNPAGTADRHKFAPGWRWPLSDLQLRLRPRQLHPKDVSSRPQAGMH